MRRGWPASVKVRHCLAGYYDVGVLLENNGPLSVRVSQGDNRRNAPVQGIKSA